MINGTIMNNKGVTDFLHGLKTNKVQYPTLTKKEERDMIDKYMALGKEEELRKLLVMHNIRMVFNLSKKYCKKTRDFDNMIEKGLYGLVYASNKFNLYAEILVDDPNDPTHKIAKIDPETGKPDYIKFCTYARNWIFKYLVNEFEDKTLKFIDNRSISLSDCVRIKNSTDNKQTVENYIDDMVSPDYIQPKTVLEELSEGDVKDFYSKIHEYVSTTNELTAIEKLIVVESFYNNKKIKDIASDLNSNSQNVIMKKAKALNKIKKYLSRTYNIKSMADVIL